MYTKNLRTACKCNAGPSKTCSHAFLSHPPQWCVQTWAHCIKLKKVLMDQFLQIGVCMLEILHSKLLVTAIYIPIKYHAYFQWRTAEQEITIADLFSTATIQLQCLQNYSSTAGKTNQQIPVLRGSLFLFYLEQFHSHLWTIFTINEEQGMFPVLGQISAICYEKFSTALPHNLRY